MDLAPLERIGQFEWQLPPRGRMRVPGVIFADEALIRDMDDKVREQVENVASLPGIVKASYAMPDAHWGYGFPIGGVAGFEAEADGVISAGGVGFDISCGVRTMLTGLPAAEFEAIKTELAEALFCHIPVGVGSTGRITLGPVDMDGMLAGGARWAQERGFGRAEDLVRIEEGGCMPEAEPEHVSAQAKQRQRKEMGTLGSGNHYLEVQRIADVYDGVTGAAFGLRENDVVVSIHCGSRGLGHQIGTEFLRDMAAVAPRQGITLPDRELACARIRSDIGRAYLGAMRAAINCALANREIIGHLVREVMGRLRPEATMDLLYDVSHNTCKVEEHIVDGRKRRLYVHRKGATRAFGPGHPGLPAVLGVTGQPVLIGGSMGTSSYILTGTRESEAKALSSACHGAGRRMSRHAARRRWRGRRLVEDLAAEGIIVRSPSWRGVAEEAPGAYKDVGVVVEAAERAGLARRVARLVPMVCVKG